MIRKKWRGELIRLDLRSKKAGSMLLEELVKLYLLHSEVSEKARKCNSPLRKGRKILTERI